MLYERENFGVGNGPICFENLLRFHRPITYLGCPYQWSGKEGYSKSLEFHKVGPFPTLKTLLDYDDTLVGWDLTKYVKALCRLSGYLVPLLVKILQNFEGPIHSLVRSILLCEVRRTRLKPEFSSLKYVHWEQAAHFVQYGSVQYDKFKPATVLKGNCSKKFKKTNSQFTITPGELSSKCRDRMKTIVSPLRSNQNQ